MPQLDFFVWFDSLLTTSNAFVLFTVVGVVGGVLVIKRGVGTNLFWEWCGRGVTGHSAARAIGGTETSKK